MGSAVRTGARPPQTVRVPRRVPLSRWNGAPPTRAASRWRLRVTHSGRSSNHVRAQPGQGRAHDGVTPPARARPDAPAAWYPRRRPAPPAASPARCSAPGDPSGAAGVHSQGGAVRPSAWPRVAGAARGEPPVASRTRRGGWRAWSRVTRAARAGAAWATAPRAPVGLWRQQDQHTAAGQTAHPPHGPALVRCGLAGAGPLCGRCQARDVTPHAPLRPAWTCGETVCHVRVTRDGEAPTSPIKRQGYWRSPAGQ